MTLQIERRERSESLPNLFENNFCPEQQLVLADPTPVAAAHSAEGADYKLWTAATEGGGGDAGC